MATAIINNQLDSVVSTFEQIGTDLESLRTAAKDNLAHIDGYYEDMTVGDAEQLVSTQGVTDTEPYLFRTTVGSSDVGNRESLRSIVGGTIAWNQFVQTLRNTGTENGITYTNNGDGSLTLNGTSDNTTTKHPSLVANTFEWRTTHKYLISLGATPPSKFYVRLNSSTQFVFADGTGGISLSAGIGIPSADITAGLVQRLNANAGVTYSNYTIKPNVFDLTQMFGSTVADYLYSLEQANAGAGVALFRSMFPKPYYEYNAGELISVQGLTSHDMVGFNQWDEQWEVGGINDSTGANSTTSNQLRSKNYTPVFPNTTYYFYVGKGTAIRVFFYDADKTFLNYVDTGTATAVTPSNAHYLRFRTFQAYGTTYLNDICINLSWSGTHNGEYEAYVKHSYPLDSSVVLRGVPKLVNNQIQYDGDTYESSGKVTRKYGIVDLGELTWTYDTSGTNPIFYAPDLINVIAKTTNAIRIVCAKYLPVLGSSISVFRTNLDDKCIGVTTSGSPTGRIVIRDTAYTDAATFKTAMSGVYLVYELATPTEETATAYQELQICNDWGTEEFVIDSEVSIPVPVGTDTFYAANLRDKLQHLPDLASADGYYMIQQSGTQMTLIYFRIPQASGLADGTYTLKATVSSGTPTYSWVLDS